MKGRKYDITGQRFGQWVAIEPVEDLKWLCKCDCGTFKKVAGKSLWRGLSKSCGCYRKSQDWVPSDRNKTHGLSHHPLYNIWRGMKKRCHNPDYSNYDCYGARGIYVCDEWFDFKTFYDWAVSHGYRKGLSLDRIDNSGPYSPANCRWADAKIQANNTRANVMLTYKGRTQTLTQWANEYGMDPELVRRRFKTWNNLERALTQPVRSYHKKTD